MTRKHRISILPYGSLKDLVQIGIQGVGCKIRIEERDYTLREFGHLDKEDPIRISMLESLIQQARLNPGIEYLSEIKLGGKKETEKTDYKIRFTKSEDTTDNESEEPNQRYISVQGTRYKVKGQGTLDKTGLSINELLEKGREAIKIYLSNEGKFPESIEFGFILEEEEQIDSN